MADTNTQGTASTNTASSASNTDTTSTRAAGDTREHLFRVYKASADNQSVSMRIMPKDLDEETVERARTFGRTSLGNPETYQFKQASEYWFDPSRGGWQSSHAIPEDAAGFRMVGTHLCNNPECLTGRVPEEMLQIAEELEVALEYQEGEDEFDRFLASVFEQQGGMFVRVP
ncbi:hypothetical protein IAT38_000265 [Cryptococcus sp. DSM 104549]